MKYDFMTIFDNYVLYFDVEPGKRVYFVSYNDNLRLYCVSDVSGAAKFVSRESALDKANLIDTLFGLNFNVMKVGDKYE